VEKFDYHMIIKFLYGKQLFLTYKCKEVKKMKKIEINERFGRLTVLEEVPRESRPSPTGRYYLCQCDCGNQKIVRAYNLTSGNSSSCGCLQKEIVANIQKKHGLKNSRLYVVWQHMRGRCERKTDKAYKWYGGRGITICEEWRNDFQAFYDWAMANGYADNLTIDRIDVNGNYEPNNCRWISNAEQQRNKRDNVRITFEGRTQTISEWAKEFNCYTSSVYREILKREGRLYGDFNE
jgi:hypothetical protein